MVPKRTPVVLVSLLLLASMPVLGNQSSPSPDSEAPLPLRAVLQAVTASYGPEAWKYDQQYASNGFETPEELASHIQNSSASYFSAMGYRVRLDVAVVDSAGNPVPAAASATESEIDVEASIETASGPLRPFVLRKDTANVEFFLDFDVDGSLAGGPGGEPLSPLLPGTQVATVDIIERARLPTTADIDRGTTDLVFIYDRPDVTITADTPRPAQKNLPDRLFRLYNDLGYGSHVTALDIPLANDQNVTIDYRFRNAPMRAVTLFGFTAARGVPTGPPPAGGSGTPGGSVNPPHIPGVTDDPAVQNALGTTNTLVVVGRTQIANGTTDQDGRIQFAISPTTVTPGAALLLLAAQLDDRPIPPGQAAGGSGVVVGAGEALVPIVLAEQASEPYEVARYALSGPGTTAPEQARTLNQLQVRLLDPQGADDDAGTAGDLFAVYDTAFESALLSSGSVRPESDPAFYPRYRSGSLTTSNIQAAEVTRYRVYSMLYGDNDAFYTMTYGDRGFDVFLEAPLARIGDQGFLYVNVTSWTTNYDDNLGDPSFEITVRFTAISEALGLNQTYNVDVPEAGTSSVAVPVSASSPGSYPVQVQAWSGDTLSAPQEAIVRFARPEQEKSFVDRIPGFESVAVLVGLIGAAAWLARRRAA